MSAARIADRLLVARPGLIVGPGDPAGISVQFATVTGLAHAWTTTSATQIWTFLAAHPLPRH